MGNRPVLDVEEAAAWFAGRLPDDWFEGPPRVEHDKDEILVVGRLPVPTSMPEGDDAVLAAITGRIGGFREDTRAHRMRIADEAQARWRRIVSWGVDCGEVSTTFTHAAVPVMTRIKLDQRKLHDTLIESGVASSRSEALSWCVHPVAAHQAEWIDRLRDAISEVERIRADGPG
jgi:hypothetical protein